jgi:predicted nucleotidyltransferase
MLSAEDKKIVAEFKRRLAAVLPVLDLRVFGSRVRGKAGPDSDLDVFVEVESCTPAQHRFINELAWEVGFESNRVISPLVATPDHLEHGPLGASPLMLQIEREGVAV